MVMDDEEYTRGLQTFPLSKIVQQTLHLTEEEKNLPFNKSAYTEAEACYIMWNIFQTILTSLDTLMLLVLVHNNQVCHLDIRPDNFFISMTG